MKNPGLVLRSFKLKFGLKLCLLTIAGVLAVTLSLYFLTSRSLGESYGSAIYTIYNLKINIFTLMFASFYSVFILAVVTAAIAVIAMLFSHKIAGPIYRIEKNLDVISSGDLTLNTRFRGNDQLVALADEINGMVRSLNHIVRTSADALEECRRREEMLALLLNKKDPPEQELLDALQALKRAVTELKKSASAVKTG